jgi:hypothetical protein
MASAFIQKYKLLNIIKFLYKHAIVDRASIIREPVRIELVEM